jgi:hypothetical protein
MTHKGALGVHAKYHCPNAKEARIKAIRAERARSAYHSKNGRPANDEFPVRLDPVALIDALEVGNITEEITRTERRLRALKSLLAVAKENEFINAGEDDTASEPEAASIPSI